MAKQRVRGPNKYGPGSYDDWIRYTSEAQALINHHLTPLPGEGPPLSGAQIVYALHAIAIGLAVGAGIDSELYDEILHDAHYRALKAMQAASSFTPDQIEQAERMIEMALNKRPPNS